MPDPAAHALDPTDGGDDGSPVGSAVDLESRIGYRFDDATLLRTALTHRSYLNEVESPDSDDNERLEFLGDALLDFVAGEYLFSRMPTAHEGELTALRSQLVCESALASFARDIDLGHHIRVGRGELSSGGRDRPAILCNTFEALIGAMYLDGGLDAAAPFALRFFRREADRALDGRGLKDAKSQFQETAQRVWQITPQYRTVGESGPDHDKRFRVAVVVGEALWGVGEGRSKSVAARRAAQEALARFQASGGELPEQTGDDGESGVGA